MKTDTMWRRPLGIVLALTLAAPDAVRADSNNGNSSQGSNGSGDSSRSSGDSSKNSGDSSKGSGDSTQNSPKSSSDSSSKGTTDESTNSPGGHQVSIALGVIAVGATVAGVLIGVSLTQQRAERRAEKALAAYMRRNHPVVTHDVALGRGPILDAWTHALGLTRIERRDFSLLMTGSAEQTALIEALDAPDPGIDDERARRFAGAFFHLTERAIGPTRARELVARASGGVLSR